MAQNVYTCVYNIVQSCTGWRDFSFFRKCRLIFHGLLLTSMRGSPSLGYEHKHCWHCITVKPITFRLLQWSILQIKESGSTAMYLSARLKRLQCLNGKRMQPEALWSGETEGWKCWKDQDIKLVDEFICVVWLVWLVWLGRNSIQFYTVSIPRIPWRPRRSFKPQSLGQKSLDGCAKARTCEFQSSLYLRLRTGNDFLRKSLWVLNTVQLAKICKAS